MMTVNTEYAVIVLRSAIHHFFYIVLLLAVFTMLCGCAGTFTRIARGSIADLTRSDWVLSDMAGVDIVTDRRPTLRFASSDGINGFSGCNKYRGVLSLSNSDITVNDVVLARIVCRIKVMEFEQDYIDRLQKVASWRIQRHSLRLMDSSGLTLLRFRRIGTPAGSNI
jgi:heat shock protein HslJ